MQLFDLLLREPTTMRSYYFYLARCADGTLYAGICTDLVSRETRHNKGTGAKYTRSRRPVRFVYHELLESRSAASKREAEVKRWPRALKEKLIKGNNRS